jgi:sporulation protein YtfJ
MKEHPINEILKTSLQNIEGMVDANKIIGEPIKIAENTIAIPISRVICGYGVGGSQFNSNKKNINFEISDELYPFGGGSGGAITLIPSAFIIINNDDVKLLHLEKDNDIVSKVLDIVKDIVKK